LWLLRDALRQAVQLTAEVFDLPAGCLALVEIHCRFRAGQSPLGAAQDRACHLQIAQQCGGSSQGGLRFRLRLGFEKQLGLVEKALADQGRAVAPGGIQLPGLPRIAVMLSEGGGHPLAVLQADARHRHQELHGHVGGDLALAHLLLDGLRQKIDQRQPPRHPTEAAIKAARQLLPSIAVALLQLRQQPALLQRRLVFREAQGSVQHESLGFAHWPDHRFHGVSAQLLERCQTLVAVDDQVAVCLPFERHHDDRRLLSRFGQRGQQPPLPSGMADAQMLPAPVKLVKLQLHRQLLCDSEGNYCGRVSIWSCVPGGRSVSATALKSRR
jgi:hypothetical protein